MIGREAVNDASERPLLARRWAGGIDTVGGRVLATMLRATRHFGCVAACGNAGGAELPITVYPFILRGVTLTGIDAAQYPMPLRHEIWRRLAEEWRLTLPDEMFAEVSLEELAPRIEAMLAGQSCGRVVVRVE